MPLAFWKNYFQTAHVHSLVSEWEKARAWKIKFTSHHLISTICKSLSTCPCRAVFFLFNFLSRGRKPNLNQCLNTWLLVLLAQPRIFPTAYFNSIGTPLQTTRRAYFTNLELQQFLRVNISLLNLPGSYKIVQRNLTERKQNVFKWEHETYFLCLKITAAFQLNAHNFGTR